MKERGQAIRSHPLLLLLAINLISGIAEALSAVTATA